MNILNNILNDKNILINMKENARNSSKKYSSSTFAKNVLKVYEKAIEKKNNETIITKLKEEFDK